MAIYVQNETERKNEAITFAKKKIEELNREIYGCDYVEDVNGKLEYMQNSYAYEKHELKHEKRQWEIMLDILTKEAPFHVLDW